MKPKTHRNPNRRRGMHPMRDFQELAADLGRFDFSTRTGANGFYCHALKKWTTGEVIYMRQMSPRMTGDDPTAVARAIDTLDELKAVALAELGAGADRGYLGASRKHDGSMPDPGGLLEKTIRELQAGHAPRNAHPRKRTGIDGKAVTKTEAARELGVSRPTIYALLKSPQNPWGLFPAHLTSWRVFRTYLDENADKIKAHDGGKRQRKRRPDIRLTKTGRTDDARSGSASR